MSKLGIEIKDKDAVPERGGTMKSWLYVAMVMAICFILVFSSLFANEDIKRKKELEHALGSARIAMDRAEFSKALSHLEDCLTLDPHNAEANFMLAKIVNLTGKDKEEQPQPVAFEYLGPKEEPEAITETLPAIQKQHPGGERAEILWEDFEGSWGPWMNDPPAGWTILDYGDETPPVDTTNDWYNYYDGTWQYSNVARVYYSPTENQDEWLITPTLNIPAATCSLKFWHYFYWYSAGGEDSAMVLGSIDDGSTWSDTVVIYEGASDGPGYRIFDITPWASNQSQAKLAFRYVGYNDWYWMVDECSVATYITLNYDVAVTAILAPPDSVPQARRNWPPRAVIHNYGTERVQDFTIFCDIGGNNPYSDSYYYSSWFNAGETDTITFTGWNPQNTGIDTMTAYHDESNDEDHSNDTLSNEVKVVRAYFTGGPDTYGYSWIDSDTTDGPAYAWVAETGGTPCSFSSYDDYEKVELPFPFRFYENTYDSLYICTNGYVSFGAGYTSYSNTSIPSTSTPNNAIYVHWDDMDPISAGDVYYKTLSGPDRFAIIWKGVSHYSGIGTASFEIILYDNGGILLQYDDVNFGNASYNFGRSATVGIENAGGTAGLEYEYNWDPYGNLLLPGRAIDFPCNDIPSAPVIYPLYMDLDGNFPIYWTESIDRDGIAGYQLDEVAPDTLLYDQANANGIFNLNGFTRSNTRSHSPTRSYGSSNVSYAGDTMISVNSYTGATSVEFWWWGGIESTIDDGYFDISIDNQASWINMGQYNYNDSTWYYENVDVSAYSGYDIYLRFRYESDVSVNYGGFWVDDILVNGWQLVQTFSTSIADTTYDITGASNGWHYYRVRGQDNVSNWGYWSGIEDIWIGPNDAPAITILTPANDTILAGTTYRIQWTDSDPDNNATISLYYDTDNTGTDGTLITTGIHEDDAQDYYDWNVSAIDGRYYIYGIIDDGVNSPVHDYSPATLTIGDLLKVGTDWIAMYISNDAAVSGDAGTYTAATEPAHPYGVDITLLYGGGAHNPWSSYNTVRSHQTSIDYVTRDVGASTESGYTVAQLSDYYSAVSYLDAQTIYQLWSVVNGQDDFDVEQIIRAHDAGLNSKLEVTLQLTNNASQNRTFSFRYEWDTHVDITDSPAVRKWHSATPDPWQIYETQWYDGGIPLSLEETDDTLFSTSTIHFLSVTAPSSATPAPVAPDSLYYIGWAGAAYPNAFQVPYGTPDVLPFTLDDAVCYMWLERVVPPGGTVSVTQYLLVSNPALNIELTEFMASYILRLNEVKLTWVTASEEDNLGFNIYRSIDNGEYEKINSELIPGAGNSSTPREYAFMDDGIEKIGLYKYKLEQIDQGGVTQMHGPTTVDIRNCIPRISSIRSVYPNPLSQGAANISFVVGLNDAGEHITLHIYDISGRIIKTLLNGKQEAGYYDAPWDGSNHAGKKVSSGVYFMVLQAGATRKVEKAVVLR